MEPAVPATRLTRLGLIAVLAAVPAVLGMVANGADKTEKPAGKVVVRKAAVKEKEKLPLFTPEREAAALRFVEQHHPELGKLIQNLKQMQPDEYEHAISEIFQTSENLANIKTRDPKRYEVMLEEWKLKSRVELLAARLTRGSNDALAGQLKDLLYQQVDIERKQLLQERERLEARLVKIDGSLKRLDEDRQSLIERRYKALVQPNKRGVSKDKSVAVPPVVGGE